VTSQAWQVAERCPLGFTLREVWAGKTLARTYMNWELARRVRLAGSVLDLGAGDRPSYWRFIARPTRLTLVDIDINARPSLVASLETGLPLASERFDAVLAFNVFEHIYRSAALARETHRVLRRGGRLYCSVPFLVPIHADPYDFFRYTGWTLQNLLGEAGYEDVKVVAYGGYFAALAEHLNRVATFAPLRTSVAATCLAMERMFERGTTGTRNAGRFVLGYYAEGIKRSPSS
jgi:SAM-dependent methyltransferase